MSTVSKFLNKAGVGFAYGVSFPLTVVIIDYWLKDCGISNSVIGLFSLLHWPFTLKFLWGPIIDNKSIPYLSKKLGQKRSWVVASQAVLILGVLGMATTDPSTHLVRMMFFASLVAFADGCQNIALYPYQIDQTNSYNSGFTAASVSFGHRFGTIVTKVLTLHWAHLFGWKIAFSGAAVLISLCMLFAFVVEQPVINKHQETLSFKSLFPFSGSINVRYIITVLMLYKASDFMVMKMSRPFYMEIGFSKAEIANIVQFFGSFAAVCGGFIGGYFIKKMKLPRAMFHLGLIHLMSLFSFLILTYTGYHLKALYFVVFLVGLTGGAMTTVFIAFFYWICKTGSHYAFLWAIHEVGGLFFSSISGFLADTISWPGYFLIAPLASLPCLLFIFKTRNTRYC